MELKEGMFARTNAGIKEIIYYEYDDGYENGHKIHFKGDEYAIWHTEEELPKANYNIAELLEVGDFLDNHCIVKIMDRTFFLNDGWFISFDDVEDLVSQVTTKEQFESIGYKIDGE